MSINKILVTLSVVATCMLHACNSTGCTDNKSSLPLAGFYSYQTLQPVTIQNISVGAVNAPDDSLLIEAGNASKLYLPFNIGENNTTFSYGIWTKDLTTQGISTPLHSITTAYLTLLQKNAEPCTSTRLFPIHTLPTI